jgi:hypothetical protein
MVLVALAIGAVLCFWSVFTGCAVAIPAVAASSYAAGQTLSAYMHDSIEEGKVTRD